MATTPSPAKGRSPTPTPAAQRSNPAEASESVSLQPASQPSKVTDEEIRARAYGMWEQAGRPDGDGAEFWYRAQQELMHRGS